MLAELAGLVKTREVAPRELVERCLRRIEELNGALNAVVTLRAEPALADADTLEKAIGEGAHVGPLAGLPLLVKDIEDVRGLPTTFGSLACAHDLPADEDGLTPARLKAAGAIVVGKTNCPEFAYESYTANALFGVTRNPWGLEWSPGGSSGGSAAALASGMTAIATATDGGGSIRIPAAFCGLAGLKPTTGLIARRPIPAWIELSTDGPLATDAADLRLLLDVMRGPLAGDPRVPPEWSPDELRRPRRLIAAERFYDWGVLPDGVGRPFWQAATDLARVLGLPLERIHPSELFEERDPDADWYTISSVEQAHLLGEHYLQERGELLEPRFRAWMEEALRVPTGEYLAARRRCFDYTLRLDELLAGEALLVMPGMTIEGILADGRLPGEAEVGIPASCFNMTVPNLTAHPALSLPAGLGPNGLPFGLQIVGPRWADDLLLNVAADWERDRPWSKAAPDYKVFAED
jgi:Asp-tRNA(Asn)/Glu-tRNA(Gln) amidotransferase A subunit family amidase